jgi:hypothetical protein
MHAFLAMSSLVNERAVRRLLESHPVSPRAAGRRRTRRRTGARSGSRSQQPSPDVLGTALDRIAEGSLQLDALLAAACARGRT